jgi:hypothetical protein
MKKFSINLKYITFTSVLILSIFSISNKVFADNTAPYLCSDGGLAMGVNLDMTPTRGPFPANSNTTFDARGQIFSTCPTPKIMNLKVQNFNNSGDPVETLVSDTLISPGFYPFVPVVKTFSVPNPSGTYNLQFKLGVNDDVAPPPPNGCYAYVRFVGTFRYGGVLWLGSANHPEVTVTVALVGNYAEGTTTNEPPDYQTFTIPQNASQSYMGEFYGVAGFDHGWVDHTSLTWACGDADQNYRDGGQQCDYTNSCGNNKTCIDPDTGYRITSPALTGECPVACRYPGSPEKPFLYDPIYNSAYCPTP